MRYVIQTDLDTKFRDVFVMINEVWQAGDEIHLYVVPATNLLDRSQKSQEISI